MQRAELEHLIRASCAIANVNEVVIVGSQSILGQFPEAPPSLLESMEADLFPRDTRVDSILIDGAIGEESLFHKTFGYYAHGVGPETAILPLGAMDRLVPIRNDNTRGHTGWCLEAHDLALSKLVVGRDKDFQFVSEMLRHGLVQLELLRKRAGLFLESEHQKIVTERIEGLVARA